MIITIILQTYIMQKSAKKHFRGVTLNKYEEKKFQKNLRGVTLFSSLLGSLLGVLDLGHLFTCFWDHFFPSYNSTYIIFVAPFRIEVKNFIESLIHGNTLKLNKLNTPRCCLS